MTQIVAPRGLSAQFGRSSTPTPRSGRPPRSPTPRSGRPPRSPDAHVRAPTPRFQRQVRAQHPPLEAPWSPLPPVGTGGLRPSRSAQLDFSRRRRPRHIPNPMPLACGGLPPRRPLSIRLASQLITRSQTIFPHRPSQTGRPTLTEFPGHSGTVHRSRCIPITLRPRYRVCVYPARPDPPCPATPDVPSDRCLEHRRDRLSCRSGGREGPARRTADLGPTALVPARAGQVVAIRRGTCP